jgi:anaerobic magnesium-protoporphyrin IX monomethyl ester cyclase
MAKIIFLQRPVEEWLGTMYVSSMLKSHGHDCEILVEPLEKRNVVENALSKSPDIVAFSCLTTDFRWALQKAKEIKYKSNVLVVMGGTHITLNPEEAIANPDIDVICIGEGEFPMKELGDAVDRKQDYGGIKNLWVRKDGKIVRNEVRDLIGNLDALPFPDRKLYTKYQIFKKRGKRPIHLGRGCPYDCTCCHNAKKKELFKNKGNYVRWRNKDNVLEEIEDIRKQCFVKVLHFIDDSFGVNREWLKDFVNTLSQIDGKKFSLQANMRADMVTQDLCEVFDSYGVDRLRLRIAVECGDEDFRRDVLRKDISNERLKQASDMLHRHKIDFITYNMLCLPGESIAQAFQTLEINLRLKPVLALCFICQPFPGTQLAEYAIEKGFLTSESLKRIGTEGYEGYYHSRSPLRQRDIEKIENLQRLFSMVVKHPFLVPLAKRIVRLQSLNPLLTIIYKIYIRKILFQRKLKDKY